MAEFWSAIRRVGFMEAGCGWVPYWLERMDEHAENYRFELPHLKERPSAYFRRQCFVSFELEERAVSYVAETVGPQTLIFASDFPHHDCFFPEQWKRFVDERISMANSLQRC